MGAPITERVRVTIIQHIVESPHNFFVKVIRWVLGKSTSRLIKKTSTIEVSCICMTMSGLAFLWMTQEETQPFVNAGIKVEANKDRSSCECEFYGRQYLYIASTDAVQGL